MLGVDPKDGNDPELKRVEANREAMGSSGGSAEGDMAGEAVREGEGEMSGEKEPDGPEGERSRCGEVVDDGSSARQNVSLSLTRSCT